MPSTHRYGTRTALPKTSYSLTNNILRGLSQQEINEVKEIKQKITGLLSQKKSTRFTAIRLQIEDSLNQILREREPKIAFSRTQKTTAMEWTQVLRDEVLRMVSKGRPNREIPLFRGKSIDGDPVRFFKTHYAKYIKTGQEVIFSIDLSSIDKPLLTALRNSVPTEEMPLGNRAAKTDAIAAGRFSDGETSFHAAHAAKLVRLKRQEGYAEMA